MTELDNCDFVVWTEHGVLSVPVKYDKIFMENALVQLFKGFGRTMCYQFWYRGWLIQIKVGKQ